MPKDIVRSWRCAFGSTSFDAETGVPAHRAATYVATFCFVASGCMLDLPQAVEGPCRFGERPCGTQCQDEQLACEPTSFNGNYVVSLVADTNDCFDDWVEGTVATANAEIVQIGADVGINVTGIAGGIFALVFGGEPVFVGTIEGDTLAATFTGAVASSQDGCTWTWRSVLELTQENPELKGSVTYRPQTNDHPSCPDVRPDCRAVQLVIAVGAPDPT